MPLGIIAASSCASSVSVKYHAADQVQQSPFQVDMKRHLLQ
jgi:hypothetical protein